MFCSHCGKSIHAEDVNCPHCGAAVTAEGARFCTACGGRLDG